jgi:hypothetical protein
VSPKVDSIPHLEVGFWDYFYPIKLQVACAMGLTSVLIVVTFFVVSLFYVLAWITVLFKKYLIPVICTVERSNSKPDQQCIDSLSIYVSNWEVYLYIAVILAALISFGVSLFTLYQLASSFREKILNVRRGEVKLDLSLYSLVSGTNYIGYQASYIGYSGILYFLYSLMMLILIAILFQFFFSFFASLLPREIQFIFQLIFALLKEATWIAVSNESILIPIISFVIFTIGYNWIVQNVAKMYFPVFETKFLRNIYIFSVYDQFATIYSSFDFLSFKHSQFGVPNHHWNHCPI